MRTVRILFICVLALTCHTASSARAQADGEGQAVDSGALRFAIALVQDLKAYTEPRVFQQSATFTMPILHPMRIMQAACVDRDGNQVLPTKVDVGGIPEDRCPNPAKFSLWYQLERAAGKLGWAMADHVAVWNSRHALRPSTDGSQDTVPGYCDSKQAENASKGRSEPCMMFNRKVLAAQGERAPFPVLDVQEFGDGVEFDRRQYFKVLVPTLYSNIAPMATRAPGPEAAAKTAMVAEFFILVDATSSMEAEIEGTKNALKRIIQDLETKLRLNARFVVIGYRDTDGASIDFPPMEGTTDSRGRLGFVSGREAVQFLEQLESGGGGDPREAIWDALYLLRDLPVTPGASRVLVLVGDAPSIPVTRGLTFGGVTVPKGIPSRTVLSTLGDTLGESASLIAMFVKSRMMKQTVDQILEGSRFYNSYRDFIENVTAATVEKRIATHLAAVTTKSADDVVAVDNCNQKLGQNDEGGSFGFFCGSSRDIPNRLRDLVQQQGREGQDTIVIRELWIPASPALQNVALLTVSEGKQMGQTLNNLAQKIGEDGTGCKKLGQTIWVEAIRALVPVEETHGAEGGTVGIPIVGKRLHDYWRLAVSKGDSLINYSPEQIAKLEDDRCFAVRNRLHRSGQAIDRTLALQKKNQYIWLSFVNIP